MTLYTAIFGPYDYVKPIFKKGDWNYVLFTDQPRNSPVFKYYDMYPELQGWDIRHVPTPKDPIREARKYKILPHLFLDGDTLWIDSTFIPNTDCWTVGDFVVVNHPFERCIYREARACLDMGKGEAEEINRQVDYYKSIGIPTSIGVISSGVIYRRQTYLTKSMCETWYEQIQKFSVRDQIGFGLISSVFKGHFTKINWNYTTRNEFIHIPHIYKMWGEDKLKDKICMHLGTN